VLEFLDNNEIAKKLSEALAKKKSRAVNWVALGVVSIGFILATWKQIEPFIHHSDDDEHPLLDFEWWAGWILVGLTLALLIIISKYDAVVYAHRASRPKLKQLLSAELSDKKSFPDETISLIRAIAPPIIKAASEALRHVSHPYRLGELAETQSLITAVLSAHFVSQFEHLGDGGHAKHKKLLVTNFHSYAQYVQQLVKEAIRLRGTRKVWCFSTWTQRMDRWFNYLIGNTQDQYDHGLEHWNEYLEFWEKCVKSEHKAIIIERCILYRNEGDQRTHDAPLVTDRQLSETLDRLLLMQKHHVDTSRCLMNKAEIDAFLAELGNGAALNALTDADRTLRLRFKSYIEDKLYPKNEKDRSHLIFPNDFTGISLPKNRQLARIRDVFCDRFHVPIPGQGISDACRESCIDGSDWTALKSVPDDLFVLGFFDESVQASSSSIVPVLAIGGDLERGGHGFGLEIISPEIDRQRWENVWNWVQRIRQTTGSASLRP
jgi:hypothetical protein